MESWKVWAGAVVLLAALVGTVLAGIDIEGAAELPSVPADVDVSSVDSSTRATRVRPIAVSGNPTLYVAPVHSTYSGATATVQVDLYRGTTFIGTAYTGTWTFDTTSNDGFYPPTDVVVATSTRGATGVDVKITALSGGPIRFKRWVGLAAPGAVTQ